MTPGAIRRTVLPGGLRVLTERMPDVRSVSVGFWAGVGSRDEEAPRQAGASHYLEHVLFKGTERRSAVDIAQAMDAIGAEHNAFTSKEYTCFYARALDGDLPLVVDVLADMVSASKLTPADVDAERTVILEEIGMHADDPDDVAYEAFAQALFGTHPLGLPVLGTRSSIEAMSRDELHTYWKYWYDHRNLVVVGTGNLEHDQFVELVAGALGEPGTGAPSRPKRAAPVPGAGAEVRKKDTEQAHVVVGLAGLPRSDPRRFPLEVFNTAFGGGTSSRLFQEVREKRGLVYSISSYSSHYEDTGVYAVHAGTSPERTPEVLGIVRDELARALDEGLTEEEVTRARGHLRGSAVLHMEDSASRMIRLGRAETTAGELLGVDDLVARYDAVTLDEAQTVARDVLGGGLRVLAAVGPFDPGVSFEEYLT